MRKPLACSLMVVAVPSLVMLAPSAWPDGPPPAARDKGERRVSRQHVPTRVVGETQVGFDPKGPPPWPAGNCFCLSPLSAEEMRKRAESGAGPGLRPGE